MKPENIEKEWQWWKKIYEKNLPFINSKRTAKDGSFRIIINTHRLHPASEGGKYVFTYAGLQEHQCDMKTVCRDMEIDGYIIRRLDVCLDADIPYAVTAKLTRFIALMIGEQISAENRYISFDPITFDSKTLRIMNGKKGSATQEVEHYNRELVDQTNYAGAPIINRFELRSMGGMAGMYKNGFPRTEESIVRRWIDRLEDIREKDIIALCGRINEALLNICGRYVQQAGKMSPPMLNNFLRFHADCIYTREQMIQLLEMMGDEKSGKHVSNLLKRSGKLFLLYETEEIQQEINCMKEALETFLTAQK